MRCPYCGSWQTKIIDSRPNVEGTKRARRYECQACSNRFNTAELHRDEYVNIRKIQNKLNDIALIIGRED